MITYRALGHCGRLGNALWELASTVGIAMDSGEKPILPANWMHRPYFSVPDEFFGEIPPDAKEATEWAQHLDTRARPYLQDWRLFWPYINVIREYLQPSPYALEILAGYPTTRKWWQPAVGIHVRRGDNVVDPGVPNKSDYHLCPTLDYYQRGIAEFDYIIRKEVFSDDLPWAQANIPAASYGVSTPHLKEHEPGFVTTEPHDWIDLFLLARCTHFVITGSTFGIWAAILADVHPARVVRPDRVYGPLLDYIDSELMFPPDWKVLPLC